MANNLFWRQINNNTPNFILLYTIKMKDLQILKHLTLDELTNLAEKYFNEKWYFLPYWEWTTMATQLCTACCKLVYKYWNDWDRYDRASVNCMWTYANWIHNHCFKLKRFSDYNDNLRYMVIKTLEMIDDLADKPAVWSVYDQKWVWKTEN